MFLTKLGDKITTESPKIQEDLCGINICANKAEGAAGQLLDGEQGNPQPRGIHWKAWRKTRQSEPSEG